MICIVMLCPSSHRFVCSVVTAQFCLDDAKEAAWLAACRAHGVTLPVLPGYLPIQNYATFTRFTQVRWRLIQWWQLFAFRVPYCVPAVDFSFIPNSANAHHLYVFFRVTHAQWCQSAVPPSITASLAPIRSDDDAVKVRVCLCARVRAAARLHVACHLLRVTHLRVVMMAGLRHHARRASGARPSAERGRKRCWIRDHDVNGSGSCEGGQGGIGGGVGSDGSGGGGGSSSSGGAGCRNERGARGQSDGS